MSEIDAIEFDRFRAILDDEVGRLDERESERFARYGVPPRPVSWTNEPLAFTASFWVVAQADDLVVFYDHIEYEWGVGRVESEGVLASYGTFGERPQYALYNFPEQVGSSLGPAEPFHPPEPSPEL